MATADPSGAAILGTRAAPAADRNRLAPLDGLHVEPHRYAVVVVCPSPDRSAELAAWLRNDGVEVATEATGAAAVRRIRAEDQDLLVLAGGSACDLSEGEATRLLRPHGKGPAIVTISDATTSRDAVRVVRAAWRTHHLERAVATASARFASVIHGSCISKAVVGADLLYLLWNPQWETQVAGCEWSPGLSLLDHTCDEDHDHVREAAAAAIASGTAVALIRRGRRPDGSAAMTNTTLIPLDGAATGHLVVEVLQDDVEDRDRPLRHMIASAPIAACALDAAGRVTAVNSSLLDLVGRFEGEVLHRPLLDLVEPAEHRRFVAAGVLDGPVHLNTVLRSRDGTTTGVAVHSAPTGLASDPDRAMVLVTEVPRAMAPATDHLTRAYALIAIIRRLQQREVESALADVVRVLADAVQAPDAGILHTDLSGELTPVAGAVVGRVEALSQNGGTGLPGPDERSTRVEMPVRLEAWEQTRLVVSRRGREPFTPQEVRFLTEVSGVIAAATAREHAYRSQRYASTHDGLTDLFNRSHLVAELSEVLRRSRGKPHAVAVIQIDVDHFHTVNETLSYATGDALLQRLAARLREVLPGNDLLARTGGDEFAIITRDHDGLEGAEAIAEELATVLAQPFDVDGSEIRISTSIGLALSRSGMESSEDLLKQAQLATSAAKLAGGARCHVFSDDLHRSAAAHLELVRNLRRAVEHREFEPWFQPVVDLGTGEVVGAEALVRWRSPIRGIVMPADFIAASEESGLVTEIGQQVLELACAHATGWRQQSDAGAPLRFSVNVSGRQLVRRDFAESVASALAATRADSRLLTISVTESVLMEDPDSAARTLQQLRDLGVSIAIANFGSGYSSLAHVRQLPVDELKVDQRFVAGLREGGAPELATAIVGLAFALDLRAVAEGIELQEQVESLYALGVTEGQGFLWSEPLPPGDFVRWLAHARQTGLAHAQGARDRTPHVVDRPAARRPDVDRVVLDAVRSILRASEPAEASAVLCQMVRRLGGYTMPARVARGNGLPHDLSLGDGEPVVAVAEAGSVTAMLLADILPDVVDDATLAIANAQQVARLASDASLDPLTGLLNRRALSRAYARLREGDVLALVDLDHFKEVNDSFGHPVGDEVLRAFGRLLREEARVADLIGRTGGDEFVLVLMRSSTDRAVEMLERVRASWPDYRPVPITFTAGIAAIGADHSAERAFERADTALYTVKETGRDSTGVFGEPPPAVPTS